MAYTEIHLHKLRHTRICTHTHRQKRRKVSTISSLSEPFCHGLRLRQFSPCHLFKYGGKIFVFSSFLPLVFFFLFCNLTFSPLLWFYLPVCSQNKIRKCTCVFVFVSLWACECVCFYVCMCSCLSVCVFVYDMSHLWLLWIYNSKVMQ